VTPILPNDLTVKIFEALYPEYALLTIGGRYIAVPAGVTVLESDSIGAIARHISEQQNSDTEQLRPMAQTVYNEHNALGPSIS
jgi:hypothetical protein